MKAVMIHILLLGIGAGISGLTGSPLYGALCACLLIGLVHAGRLGERAARRAKPAVLPPVPIERPAADQRRQDLCIAVDAGLPFLDFDNGTILTPVEARAELAKINAAASAARRRKVGSELAATGCAWDKPVPDHAWRSDYPRPVPVVLADIETLNAQVRNRRMVAVEALSLMRELSTELEAARAIERQGRS